MIAFCLRKIIYFLCFCSVNGFAVVRILTFHCNLPQLLEMQCRALNKFVVEDFELIVFNDASDPEIKLEIEAVSAKYGATCVRFEPQWHDYCSDLNSYIRNAIEKSHVDTDLESPSLRHSRIIRYALENYGYSHDDIVVVLDGDAFPIRTVSLNLMLQNLDIIGSLRGGHHRRVTLDPMLQNWDVIVRGGYQCEYFMPVFVAFDPRKLEAPSEFQLHWDVVHGQVQDTGAASYYYMEEHPEVKIGKIPLIQGDCLTKWSLGDFRANNLGSREIELVEKLRGFYYEIHMDWHVFHYKGSSHARLRPERHHRICEFLDKILSEDCPPLREIQIGLNAQEAPFPGDD